MAENSSPFCPGRDGLCMLSTQLQITQIWSVHAHAVTVLGFQMSMKKHIFNSNSSAVCAWEVWLKHIVQRIASQALPFDSFRNSKADETPQQSIWNTFCKQKEKQTTI